nr:NADH dehydrogenase subunit 5 [Campanulotes compar]
MLWVWVFFFPFFIGLFGFVGGLFFLKSIYLLSWEITVFRESNFEVLLVVDSFSMIFLFTVGMVSSFVLLYSNYYMMGSLFKKKFILVMMIFILSMFVLSLSGDLFWVMIGWDGLGFSSMCLIFFFQNWKSFNSSMVTFISNRIGDFLIISFFCFSILFNGSLFFENYVSSSFLGLFLCFGALSKSAQVPFSAWLPLAMAAPTPVSSLVHSSTLVTAGVFLLIRFKSFLCEKLFSVIFLVSFITIFLAGMSSVGEYDLKKVIALSTLSHIGLMMMFVGMESFISAKIHLVIHAFFKSLLFMISGFIIHENNNFQDIRLISMSSSNYFFSMTFLLSTFSMMGAPFFSGFFSKEILLGWVYESTVSMVSVLLFFFSVSLTCSYSIRLLFYFFFPCFSFSFMIPSSEYPSKMFFFMSVVSSFLAGVMVFVLIGKEESEISFTVFSSFQKVGLLVSIAIGLLIGGVFSFFFSLLNSKVLKVCQNMWMISSMNYMPQKLVFNVSSFFFLKSDVKFLDYFTFFSGSTFSSLSKFCMKSLYLNPFIYLKVCCFLGLSIFFFI